MSQIASHVARAVVQLGQQVRLAAQAWQRPGCIVAVMAAAPYAALVWWPDTEATFEALDDLVNAHGAALADPQRPTMSQQDTRMLEGRPLGTSPKWDKAPIELSRFPPRRVAAAR